MTIPLLVAGTYGFLTQERAEKHIATVASSPSSLVCGEVSLTAAEIYQRIRGGQGPGSIVRAQETAHELARRHWDRGDQIGALRARMAESWRGDASESATAHTEPLSEALRQSHDLLEASTGPLLTQAEDFQRAYVNVELVPEKPPTSSLLNDAIPFTTDTDRAIADYNTKASKNVQVYNQYNGASHSNGGALPTTYPQLPIGGVPPIVVRGSGQKTVPTARGTGGTVPASGTVSAGRQASSASGQSNPTTGGQPIGGLTPPVSGTASQGWVPDPVAGQRSPVPTAVSGGFPPAGGGGAPVGPIAVSGPRSGAGGSGMREGAPGGPRSDGRAGGAAGAAGRSGVGGPGGRATGAPGGAPLGGGRGRDEEDVEHRNKYLTEPDKNEMFGSDEFYAPPVIGDR
jgi:hypothetical protein